MNTLRIPLSLLVLSLVCACGKGPAQPRLSKIDSADGSSVVITYNEAKVSGVKVIGSSGQVGQEMTITYTDNRITSVLRKAGSSQQTSTLVYEDGRLKTTTVADGDGKTLLTYTYTYADGKLSKLEASGKLGTITVTTTNEYTYADNRLKHEKVTYAMGALAAITNIEYVYDDKNLLLRTESTAGDTTTITNYAYDDKQRLQKVTLGESSTTYEYTEDKVSKVINTHGSTSTISTYSYDKGDGVGVVPVSAPKFDLAGRMIPVDNTIPTSDILFGEAD